MTISTTIPAEEALTNRILNIAAYKFVPLDRLPQRRKELKEGCLSRGIRGTILLSSEGINLFLAGDTECVRSMLAELRQGG